MIDDFTIIRALDSKQPQRTFLVRRSDNAEATVLKFCNADSLQSQILQTISHPHICQWVGQGGHEDNHYLLLSYYGSQTLLNQVEEGVAVTDFLVLLQQIATALDFLHAKGYVHGDLSPEHILIKQNQQPVLIDFDCALLTGTRQSPEDSMYASPAYVAPERIRGLTTGNDTSVSGASDYYSLGVIGYQMLSGRLPFADDDVEASLQSRLQQPSQSNLQSHLQDSAPKLPSYLQALQQVIDGLMHQDPAQRISDAKTLSTVIGKISDSDTKELGARVIRSAAIGTQELSSLFADLRLRPDELAKRDKRNQRKRQRRIALQSTAAIIITGLLLASLLTYREDLAPVIENAAASLGIIENPELTAAWREAQSLASDPNQGLGAIVAAYRRVIEIAPDYAIAQQALSTTAKSWKFSITQALSENDLETAQARLREAQSVFGPDSELTVLTLRLQNRFRAERLLTSTQSLLRSSGLSDEASAAAAVQAFEEILRIVPSHAQAAAGLTQIGLHYGELAGEAAREGEVAEAIRLLQRATAADNNLRELDQVRRLISEATTIQSAIADLLAKAQSLRGQAKLIGTGANSDSAAAFYLQVLATDPDNLSATEGMAVITEQIITQTQRLLDQGQIPGAQALLANAENQGLNPMPIANMRERIDSVITLRSQIAVGLEQASVLFQQGFVSGPDDNNAVAKLQEVLRLDADNSKALELLVLCAERLARVATQANDVGMTPQAKNYLKQALDLRPESAQWRQWLQTW